MFKVLLIDSYFPLQITKDLDVYILAINCSLERTMYVLLNYMISFYHGHTFSHAKRAISYYFDIRDDVKSNNLRPTAIF